MELRDYVSLLRTYWLTILAFVVGAAVIGLGWTALQPRVYSADASGYVASTSSDGSTGAALAGDQLALSKVKSYLDIGSWRSVAVSAIDSLSLDTTPEALVQQVTVSNPTDTVIIRVTAKAATPEAARDLAEAWITGMVAEIKKIETGQSNSGSALTLIPGDSARLPTAPSSPNVKLDILIAAVIGLVLGVAYALVRRALDRRIRSAPDVEKAANVAAIAAIPAEKMLYAERKVFSFNDIAADRAAFAHTEAVRELRTNLQYVDVDNPPRVIVVTSPLPGDGKSSVSANLAMSIAAAGQRVLLIDADLRRPVVASLFGFTTDVGLSDVLAGNADIGDVARPVDTAGNLYVIGAGRTPPNPSEVLGSQRMRALLSSLREEMMVIIDTPPIIPVADAAVLGAIADGALIVISAGKTTVELLQRAVKSLQRANGNLLGVVLNKVPRRGGHGSYYHKSYYHAYYGPHDGEQATDRATTSRPAKRGRAGLGVEKRVDETPAARRTTFLAEGGAPRSGREGTGERSRRGGRAA